MAGDERGGKNLLLKLYRSEAIAAQILIQDLIYKAVLAGVAGNSITITYTSGGTAGSEVVTVVSSAISVQIAVGVSTAAQIKAAIEASGAASALVSVHSYGSPLSSTQIAQTSTSLQDGHAAVSAAQTLGGLRSKSYKLNNEAIDVTNHASEEWRKILNYAGINSVTVTGAGVFTTDENIAIIRRLCEDKILAEFGIVDVDDSKVLKGFFKVTAFERSGEYNAEQPYTCNLESSGRTILGNS